MTSSSSPPGCGLLFLSWGTPCWLLSGEANMFHQPEQQKIKYFHSLQCFFILEKALKETYIYEGGPFCGKLNLVRVNIISRLDHETTLLIHSWVLFENKEEEMSKFMFQVLYIFIVCHHTHTVLNLIQFKWRYLRLPNIYNNMFLWFSSPTNGHLSRTN